MNAIAKTPVHLWAVGVLSLLWNAVGAFDYMMTKLGNADYLSAFTPEQIAYFQGFPLWANIGWAFGVWGSVLGSILLLARSRHAVTAFARSEERRVGKEGVRTCRSGGGPYHKK